MSGWTSWKSKLSASAKTTNRINALLNESMTILQTGKKKTLFKNVRETPEPVKEEEPEDPLKIDIIFFRKNFNMEHIYKMIETVIEDRLLWDRFNRVYDPWRSVKFAESLAVEVKDKVKKFKHSRRRIVCFVSVVEKNHQGCDYKMHFFMDPKKDNFTNYVYEMATYFIVVTVFLVYKE